MGSPYFRELKLQKFRIYFQIFEEEVVVLLISVSDKKQQKEAIKLINEKREELVDYIKNLNEK